MKKFKVIYDCHDGFDKKRHFEIVEANNEDEAEEIVQDMHSCEIEVYDIVYVFDTQLNNKLILIDMPDNFTYGIPVMVIAENRAWYYRLRNEFNDFYESMVKDTLPLFESDEDEIIDWAKSNMNFADVKDKAHILKKKEDFDYEDVWVNGDMVIK